MQDTGPELLTSSPNYFCCVFFYSARGEKYFSMSRPGTFALPVGRTWVMSSHLNPQPIHPPSGAKEGGFSDPHVCAGFLQASGLASEKPWGEWISLSFWPNSQMVRLCKATCVDFWEGGGHSQLPWSHLLRPRLCHQVQGCLDGGWQRRPQEKHHVLGQMAQRK